MISLIQILKEIQSNPKAIIMAGGASVGKSTVLKSLESQLSDFNNLNADKYVEDKDSPLYGNLGGASSKIKKEDLPQAIESKSNFIYDTTASNLKTLKPLVDNLKDNGYDVMMLMVYAHPIVSFLRNFKRERKVPLIGIIGTWVKVYNLIEDYKKMFGDNFILVTSSPSSTEEKDQIESFQTAQNQGKLKEYFDELMATGEYRSSFRKDDSKLSPEELEKREKQRDKTDQAVEKSIEELSQSFDRIQASLDPISMGELPILITKFTS
jgi:predicted kinase